MYGIVPGHVFSYQRKMRYFRRRAGGGQVLGWEDDYQVLFIRVFDVSGEDWKRLIDFLPITCEAYEASRAKVVKWLPLPDAWDALRDEWRAKWQVGEAGVFSQPLADVTSDTLETVEYLREGGVIEMAFPKRSASGQFDTIQALVRPGPPL